jgi:hypothetical protein
MLTWACGRKEIAEGKPSEEKKAAAHDPAAVRAERKQPAYVVCVSSVCFEPKAPRAIGTQNKSTKHYNPTRAHSQMTETNVKPGRIRVVELEHNPTRYTNPKDQRQGTSPTQLPKRNEESEVKGIRSSLPVLGGFEFDWYVVQPVDYRSPCFWMMGVWD